MKSALAGVQLVRRSGLPDLRGLGSLSVAAVLVAVLFLANVVGHVPLSLIDEFAHIDNLVRASHLDLVRVDDHVSQEAMREAACRGSDVGEYPPCGAARYEPEDFAWRGYSPAANHTPHYYFITGMVGRALAWLTWENSIVTWGRLLGTAWFLAGVGFTWRIARRLGVGTTPLAAAILAVAATPAVLHASTRVNPDATAFLGGALVLLFAIAWEQRETSLARLCVASYVCASLDSTNALAVVAAMLYLCIRLLQPGTIGAGDRRRAASGIGALLLGVIIAFTTWRLAVLHLGPSTSAGSPQEVAHHVEALSMAKLLGPESVFAIFPPLSGYVWPNQMTTAVRTLLTAVIVLAQAGLVGLATRASSARRLGAFGAAAAAVLLLGGPLLVLQNYVLLHWYFPITSRHGLSVAAGVVVALAWLAQSRPGLVLVGVSGGGLAVASVVRFL